MAGQLPIAMFGLEVVPGDFPIAAVGDIPTAFRITMAAIDPTAEPEGEEGAPPRATLKIMRRPIGMDDESDDDSEGSFDADEMEAMLAEEDDDDDDEDDEMVNGGPSDPSKSKKARVAAIKKMLADEVMDVDGEDEKPALTNGVAKSAKSKGKMPASDEDEDEEEDDESDEDGEIEEFILCTLDPQKVWLNVMSLTTSKLTTLAELPTAPGLDHWRGRASVLQGHWHPQHLPHRQLRRASRLTFWHVRPRL